MTDTKKTRVLIIGSGPAGYTAAIYAGRAMLEPVLVEGDHPGGQLTTTTDVENWPGLISAQGPEMMEDMRAHAEAMGTEIITERIESLELGERPFRALGASGCVYEADAVILATGARARWLGLPSEERLKGYGVSACATCDGFFFRDQEVVVVGGGNTAVEEALYMSSIASKVTLVNRGDALKAEMVLQERLFKTPGIEVIWNHETDEIVGEEAVEGVRLRHSKTGEITEVPAGAVFIAIGHLPASELVSEDVETHHGGYVVTKPGSTATSIPGLFAAGDVTDHQYRQAITSAGMGCMAALEAERFLAS
ncbi:thioredoxin-disulfide reductase [Salipiger sp. PrR003]|uniref:thioredoxin-disulfide reductase n=1 Tax=Salipiger sp. PrR003 TaxID=2706776 RepID=UPI0013DC2F88|nr:thioredoxin-disulfide reductase [Salipiger sp. PrR003]NDV50637.1 thioredoxin-disulfide reductase [Salipiger sp. PrR003]